MLRLRPKLWQKQSRTFRKRTAILCSSSSFTCHGLLSIRMKIWYVNMIEESWDGLLTCFQMTPLNLAVVFAPTIMRPMDIQRELSDVQQQRVAVQALLENYKTVFGEE